MQSSVVVRCASILDCSSIASIAEKFGMHACMHVLVAVFFLQSASKADFSQVHWSIQVNRHEGVLVVLWSMTCAGTCAQVGAGTMNPATFLRVLGPEPWSVCYVEPSVRPDDSRYGENPNRLQQHTQFQASSCCLSRTASASANINSGSRRKCDSSSCGDDFLQYPAIADTHERQMMLQVLMDVVISCRLHIAEGLPAAAAIVRASLEAVECSRDSSDDVAC